MQIFIIIRKLNECKAILMRHKIGCFTKALEMTDIVAFQMGFKLIFKSF